MCVLDHHAFGGDLCFVFAPVLRCLTCQGEAYELDVLYNAKTDGGLNAGTLSAKINGKGPLLFVGKTNTKSDCLQLSS